MDGRKYPGPIQHSMQRATSASAIGSNNIIRERNRQSESGIPSDALPPKPPAPATTTSGGTTTCSKTGLRLGGLSKYLMEKAQSNDSGFDLSPGTLETLVHPLRTSNSSSSSLHVRNLFESPATSSSEESPQCAAPQGEPKLAVPSTPLASRSALAEQSHNSSETTIIEKTLTDDQSSRNVTNTHKKDHLEPIFENNKRPPRPEKDKTKESIPPFHQSYSRVSKPHQNPDNITPKDRGFQVPYGYTQGNTKPRASSGNNENTDPDVHVPVVGSRTYTGYQSHQNDSFPSSEVAAVISSGPSAPTTGEHVRKGSMQTPKPKSCKKKPSVSSTKKPSGSGWKFLSEHVNGKEFLIIKQLGKGGCGEVSLVMEKDTRRQYALKTVQLHGIDEAMVQECINEVEMLIDLKGTDLVVDIYNWEFNQAEKTMKILMEQGQCDLNHTIYRANKTQKPIKLLKIRYIWESLLTIVQEIHSKGIVHADLKPANFVWFDDNLKIIDFGIASRLQNDLTSIAMPNPKGTLNFISPEIIKLDASGRSKLSPKSDIWALGCILYLMVYGRTPFEHITHPVTKMNAIVQGDIMYPTLPRHLRESDVISVLKLCFQTDYKRRPTASELLRHPFVCSQLN